MATSILKKAFDARGLKKADLCSVPGLNYSHARRIYEGEREIGPQYAIKIEGLFGISRSILRPDLWPPSGTPAAAAEETCPENEAKSCPKSAEK